MNRILIAKTGRDLRRRLPQFVAIGLTVMIGVLLFVATSGASRNLNASYQRTYERLHFADLTATGGDSDRLAAAARSAGGVQGVTIRTSADLPLEIGGAKLVGRVVGLPPGGQPAVGRVAVTSGEYLDPADRDGVLVEAHAAETFSLAVGARVRAFDGSTWRDLTIRGVVDSAEYLWPSRSRQDVLGDPHAFAVLFVPEPTAVALAGKAGTSQTLVEFDAATRAGGGTHVADAVRAAGAVDVQPRSEQPSDATLQQDLTGFAELSVAFPALFLAAAAIAAYVLITRLVLAERRVIATFLAAGAHRGPVVRHYLTHGLVTGTVAAVLGVLLGTVATAVTTRAYTTGLDIPDTVVRQHPVIAVLGVLFGAAVGLAGGAVPALATSRTAPAEAMRGDAGTLRPPGPLGRALGRARRLPATWRLALRELARSRRRTLATIAGTVLALILVLVSAGMITTMQSTLRVEFDQIQLADATVTVNPRATDLPAELRGTPGVAAVEPVTTIQVTAAADGRAYSTALSGYQPDTRLRGFRAEDGHLRGLPSDGVLAGKALADRLHVRTGDTIQLTPTSGGGARPVRLAGLLDEPLGTALYGTLDTVEAATGAETNGYLLGFDPGASRDRLRAEMTGLDGVVAYADGKALEEQVGRYLGLFWIFVGVMLVLGAILALTIIYVTMTVNIAERTTELATLRAAGVPVRRIAGLLAAENLVAVVIAVPIGLAAGALAAYAALQAFSSDLFSLRLQLGWPTLLAAAVAVLAASLLSQLPAMRAIRRLDVARVVRERA